MALTKIIGEGVGSVDTITADSLTIDTNTLFVDSANNRVGIGTASSLVRDLNINGTAANSKAFVRFSHDGLASTGLDVGYSSAGYASIYNAENTAMVFSTNASERMRIDNGGNVGIGISSPSQKLSVAGNLSFPNQNSKIVFSAGNSSNNTIRAEDGSGFASAEIAFVGVASNQSTDITFSTGNSPGSENITEAMRINYSGNVGIGTSSPSVVAATGGSKVLHIHNSAASSASVIHLTNPATGSGATDGALFEVWEDGDAYLWNYEAQPIIFGTSGTEAMRIDSSGNFMVSTTDNTLYNNTSGSGLCYRPNFSLDIAREATSSGNYMLSLNNTGVDAKFINFGKNGSSVGSISTQGSHITIGTANTGLRFKDSVDAIQPQDITNATGRDNAIDLGTNLARFKDLYLSGGAYIGGTGSANKLDDFEEGSFTPTYAGSSVNPTITYNTASTVGRYVKVGGLVHIQGRIRTNSTSGGSGHLYLSGLPFTPISDSNAYTSLQIGYSNNWAVDHFPVTGYNQIGVSYFYLVTGRSSDYRDGVGDLITCADLTNGTNCNDILFSATYRTAS